MSQPALQLSLMDKAMNLAENIQDEHNKIANKKTKKMIRNVAFIGGSVAISVFIPPIGIALLCTGVSYKFGKNIEKWRQRKKEDGNSQNTVFKNEEASSSMRVNPIVRMNAIENKKCVSNNPFRANGLPNINAIENKKKVKKNNPFYVPPPLPIN